MSVRSLLRRISTTVLRARNSSKPTSLASSSRRSVRPPPGGLCEGGLMSTPACHRGKTCVQVPSLNLTVLRRSSRSVLGLRRPRLRRPGWLTSGQREERCTPLQGLALETSATVPLQGAPGYRSLIALHPCASTLVQPGRTTGLLLPARLSPTLPPVGCSSPCPP